MATVENGFPLLEAAFVALLEGPSGDRAGTSLPAALEALPGPFHRVTRGPGADDGTTDAPLIDIETFARSRREAARAAEDARQLILGSRASTVAGALLDDVSTASGPIYLDYDNPHVQRYVASYRVAVRRTT